MVGIVVSRGPARRDRILDSLVLFTISTRLKTVAFRLFYETLQKREPRYPCFIRIRVYSSGKTTGGQ